MIEEISAERDEWERKAWAVFFEHQALAERIADGHLVPAPRPNLSIVRDSQVREENIGK